MSILVKSSTSIDEKDRWATRHDCFADAEYLFGRKFHLDVCAEPPTAKVKKFITPHSGFTEQDGQAIFGVDALTTEWIDGWWCNPPFSKKSEFIDKAIEQQAKGHSGMMLLPYEPATQWWQSRLSNGVIIYEPDGRYNFLEVDGVTGKTGVNFASAFVVFPSFKINTSLRVQFKRGLSSPERTAA